MSKTRYQKQCPDQIKILQHQKTLLSSETKLTKMRTILNCLRCRVNAFTQMKKIAAEIRRREEIEKLLDIDHDFAQQKLDT